MAGQRQRKQREIMGVPSMHAWTKMMANSMYSNVCWTVEAALRWKHAPVAGSVTFADISLNSEDRAYPRIASTNQHR